MPVVSANPTTLAGIILHVGPGDEVNLEPGIYSRPIRISDRRGTSSKPIIIRGAPGVVFDGGRSAEAYREEGNRRSLEVQRRGQYPGLWPFIEEAMITIERCSNVLLENLAIQQCWPTAILVKESQATTLRRLLMEDSTFAVAALGAATYGITVDEVIWCQDVTRERLWRRIPWTAVHGEQLVNVDEDWRLFDGDFFRSADIRGGVTIKDCRVEHAFNAVHGFNDKNDRRLSYDFAVHDCHFSFIRDNVFEPEDHALNWWFYRNRIINCHKWFSIETSSSGFIYIFANLAWFDEIPGQPGQDNRAGGVFKLAKHQIAVSGKHYVFNNSFAVRSDYIRKGTLLGLRHWANAVRYCQPGEGECDVRDCFFGDLTKPPNEIDKRFASDWRSWDIAFADDVIAHGQYKAGLEAAGYGPFAQSQATDPGFLNPLSPGPDGSGLALIPTSPCKGKAAEQAVEMPDGAALVLPSGRDIGAFQGRKLLQWSEFVPLPNLTS